MLERVVKPVAKQLLTHPHFAMSQAMNPGRAAGARLGGLKNPVR